jgi:hypothetical protein
MRTANDFNFYYRSPDPWGINHASRRDNALSRVIAPYVAGKRVLELGCGEGHLNRDGLRHRCGGHRNRHQRRRDRARESGMHQECAV